MSSMPSLLPLEFVLSVPGKVNRIRPQSRVFGESDLLSVIITKRFLIRTLLRKLSNGDEHDVVIRNRPKSLVKKPMGILAQCQAVPRVGNTSQ